MTGKAVTSSWKFWLILGLTTLCAVLIVGGLLFGWSPKDDGFMTYCQPAQGEIVYETQGAGSGPATGCQNAKPVGLSVNRRPWKVLSLGGPEFSKAVQEATKDLNGRVGCTLFVVPAEAAEPDIVITKGAVSSGPDDHVGGSTSHKLVGDVWKADIVMYNLVLVEELHRGLMHELGHAMGLAHDSFKDSLMHKGTSGTDYLTDGDKSALRERYCGAK